MSTQETSHSALHSIAALYQRSVLDPMVEVARAVSYDFVMRPRHYRAVPEKVSAMLEGFRMRTGSNPEWPNASQRAHLFAAIFDDTFRTTGIDLRSAARAFTERGAEMSPDPLEDRVRDAAAAFRAYLKGIDGRAVASADSETGPLFRSAVQVFQDRAVAGVFGLPAAPGGNWPLDGAVEADAASSDGAFLIEEIQRALSLSYIRPAITQHLFVLLQRMAYYGAMTIAGVLEDAASSNRSGWIPALVRNAYGWEKALQSAASYIDDKEGNLEPRVVSRHALEDKELKSLPTEEDAKRSGAQFAQQTGGGGGGGGPKTCLSGWTLVCDTGPSCTYGFTLRCDTGPTCISGWTIVCDTGPTCTYGWTLKCDMRGL